VVGCDSRAARFVGAAGIPARDGVAGCAERLSAQSARRTASRPLALPVAVGFRVHGEREDGTIVVRRDLA
jgi:hypothetical protein